jgi:uncharacterized protein YtpQ (UPF0354 family)
MKALMVISNKKPDFSAKKPHPPHIDFPPRPSSLVTLRALFLQGQFPKNRPMRTGRQYVILDPEMSELSREQFAQSVVDLVRKQFPLAKVARAPEPFSMRLNGRVVPLESLYRSYLLRPDMMESQVQRWVVELIRADEGLPDKDATFDELKARIMPIVVSSEKPTTHPGIFVQSLVDGLNVSYVIDSEKTIAHIPINQLDRWKVDAEALHEVAIENLVERSQDIAAEAAQDDGGRVNFLIFQTNDGYDSSRILLPNLHERLREHLGSPFLVAVPNRDILICFRAGTESVERIRKQVSDDYTRMPHQVTDRLFIVTADGLAPFFEGSL